MEHRNGHAQQEKEVPKQSKDDAGGEANDSSLLLSTCYLPGTVLHAFPVLTHSVHR